MVMVGREEFNVGADDGLEINSLSCVMVLHKYVCWCIHAHRRRFYCCGERERGKGEDG
jgi:hypothetical protein